MFTYFKYKNANQRDFVFCGKMKILYNNFTKFIDIIKTIPDQRGNRNEKRSTHNML